MAFELDIKPEALYDRLHKIVERKPSVNRDEELRVRREGGVSLNGWSWPFLRNNGVFIGATWIGMGEVEYPILNKGAVKNPYNPMELDYPDTLGKCRVMASKIPWIGFMSEGDFERLYEGWPLSEGETKANIARIADYPRGNVEALIREYSRYCLGNSRIRRETFFYGMAKELLDLNNTLENTRMFPCVQWLTGPIMKTKVDVFQTTIGEKAEARCGYTSNQSPLRSCTGFRQGYLTRVRRGTKREVLSNAREESKRSTIPGSGPAIKILAGMFLESLWHAFPPMGSAALGPVCPEQVAYFGEMVEYVKKQPNPGLLSFALGKPIPLQVYYMMRNGEIRSYVQWVVGKTVARGEGSPHHTLVVKTLEIQEREKFGLEELAERWKRAGEVSDGEVRNKREARKEPPNFDSLVKIPAIPWVKGEGPSEIHYISKHTLEFIRDQERVDGAVMGAFLYIDSSGSIDRIRTRPVIPMEELIKLREMGYQGIFWAYVRNIDGSVSETRGFMGLETIRLIYKRIVAIKPPEWDLYATGKITANIGQLQDFMYGFWGTYEEEGMTHALGYIKPPWVDKMRAWFEEKYPAEKLPKDEGDSPKPVQPKESPEKDPFGLEAAINRYQDAVRQQQMTRIINAHLGNIAPNWQYPPHVITTADVMRGQAQFTPPAYPNQYQTG